MIIATAAFNSYMPEISARSFGNQDEYTTYLMSISDKVYSEIADFYNKNYYLMTLVNAAQTVVLFIIFKLIYKRPVSQIGLSRQGWLKRAGLGGLVGLSAISLYAVTASLSGVAKFSGFNPSNFLTSDMLLSIVFFISVGFYEEVFFRGFFMTVLKTTRNKRLIVVLPTLAYGLLNYVQNPQETPVTVINIVLIGLAFAYLFIKTGSLWMSIGYHIMWNFFQSCIYGVQANGLEQISLLKYTTSESNILTGGAFGVEGGLICTAVTLCLLAYIHFGLKADATPAWTMDSDLPFSIRKDQVG